MPGRISMIEVDHHSSGVFSFFFFVIAGSYCPLCFQLCYRLTVVPKLFEDFLSVGAEQRGWRGWLWVPACETESRAHDGNLTIGARHGLKVFDEVSLCDLRMFKDFGDG